MKVTLSIIKADVGSYCGHNKVHPELMNIAKQELEKAKKKGEIIDYFVFACGDDLELLMSHKKPVEDPKIHELAWNIFTSCTKKAKEMKLYGAGQDMLKETFSGNVKGMGPGVAEMSFEERPSEPVVVLAADKTDPGAWNIPLFKTFADPFTNPGLVISPVMSEGFTFEVQDVIENKSIEFKCPDEMYELLAFIGTPGRYVIKNITRNQDGLICAATSTTRLSLIAGKYIGKDDPVCIVRAQHDLPDVGEIVEPYAFPYLVEGWNRGSHTGPLMPVSLEDAMPTRFDGPPRVVALGFVISNGKLIGPVDLFKDVSFDHTREMANKIADYMRMHGPFQPHRLPENDMEYTSMPKIKEKLKNRWKKV
jgi:fructose 1,6-bisphosphate aldolase/phosphatase